MASQIRTSLAISAASSGANTLLAAQTGYKIRVLAYTLVSAGTVTAQFRSGAAGAVLTGAMTLIAGVPLVVPLQREGHFETTVTTLLNLVLGGATQVSGHCIYELVAA